MLPVASGAGGAGIRSAVSCGDGVAAGVGEVATERCGGASSFTAEATA
ncbi:hypothetical protein R2F25_27955 [Streptomyces sp. UP1A-1]|nr:hypothetical protein [Streptomyces sp. UP1A-1]